MKFTKTNTLLEVNYGDGNKVIYYTFKANTNEGQYYHPLDKKDYILIGCYGGDTIKYYKNENKVELIDCVTNEVTVLTDRKYKIYEDMEG